MPVPAGEEGTRSPVPEARVEEGVEIAFEPEGLQRSDGQKLVAQQRGNARDAHGAKDGGVVGLLEPGDDAIESDIRVALAQAQDEQVGALRVPDRHVVEDLRVVAQNELDGLGVRLVGVEPLAVDATGPQAARRNSTLKSISTPSTEALLGSEAITS